MTIQSTSFRFLSGDQSFHFFHSLDANPDPNKFGLHYEDKYEIYMFLSGTGSFTVEGNKYELQPYSILLLNPNELHVAQISHLDPYERIVLHIHESFLPPFLLGGIDFFKVFNFRKLGYNNQISPQLVKECGLPQLFERLEEHLKIGTDEDEFVAKCIIVQILSALNRVTAKNGDGIKQRGDVKAKAVIEYINKRLDESLTLDELAEHFFVTKYHLCRLFKEATGYSINQYITYKRIRMADALMVEGHTPTQACYLSGFNNYSSFYKAYRKLTGQTPRKGKAKH